MTARAISILRIGKNLFVAVATLGNLQGKSSLNKLF